nr:MAG TPA: hypothetical protein [Caudoviricetes sp.]
MFHGIFTPSIVPFLHSLYKTKSTFFIKLYYSVVYVVKIRCTATYFNCSVFAQPPRLARS